MNHKLYDFKVHQNIHNDMMAGCSEWRIKMKQSISSLEYETLSKEMESFIEFIETDIIPHHDESSQDGFYNQILSERPELTEKIHHLSRDHQLIRIITDLMKKELQNDEVNFQKLVDYSSSVTLINEIHSKDEEESLLK